MSATKIKNGEIRTIQPSAEIMTKQGLPYWVGVSGRTAGSQKISMSLVIILPGGSAHPHYHRGYETAIYILEGRAETLYGEDLKQSVVNKAGDFLYIPAGLPHQPVNLSETEPVKAIIARSDANEQESVVLYPVR